MTALPQPLDHLLTVAEYAELGETESGYTGLLEGRLVNAFASWVHPGRGSET